MRHALVALVLLLAAPLAAQPTAPDTPYHILGLAPSARSAALAAPAAIAVGADGAAFLTNPALLSPDHGHAATLSFLNLPSDIASGTLTYVRQIDRLQGTVAASVRYLTYGDFERIDADQMETGETFGAHNTVVSVGYARPVSERLRVGVNGHALFARIDDRGARAVALDAGLLYTLPDARTAFSVSIHQVGAVLSSLGETDDALPFDLRVGAARRLQNVPVQVSVTGYDLHHLGSGDGSAIDHALNHLAVGLELAMGRALALRVGYNDRIRDGLAPTGRLDFAGVGLGVGLNLRRVAVDYAYTGWSSFGSQHLFTVQTRL